MMIVRVPRLHMGCGEALRSHWLLRLVRREQVRARTQTPAKHRREQTRG